MQHTSSVRRLLRTDRHSSPQACALTRIYGYQWGRSRLLVKLLHCHYLPASCQGVALLLSIGSQASRPPPGYTLLQLLGTTLAKSRAKQQLGRAGASCLTDAGRCWVNFLGKYWPKNRQFFFRHKTPRHLVSGTRGRCKLQQFTKCNQRGLVVRKTRYPLESVGSTWLWCRSVVPSTKRTCLDFGFHSPLFTFSYSVVWWLRYRPKLPA